jgi:predicted dehydrogenase/nucleoside-diphosphate-sugar epimerase
MTYDPQNQTGAALRVAIVGTGKMGLNHIHALRGCTGARLVAVCDPIADQAQLSEHLPRGAEVSQDVDAMLARVQPDVVHIVTPPHTHTALARAALQAGSHVYVEKPFTPTKKDAEMLTRLAAERGRQVCAGHQCLFDHASVTGRRRLGEVGEVVQVESYFSFRTVRKSITPMDQALDILPHAVYMLLDVLRSGCPDEPLAIEGLAVSVDGSVNAILTLGPRRGVLTVSLRARPVEQYVHVAGTNGTLRIDLVTGAVVVLPGAGANIGGALVNPFRYARQTMVGSTRGFIRNLRDRRYGYPGLRPLFRAFYDSIRTGAPAAVPAQAIVETVAVCEEIGNVLTRKAGEAERTARAALMAAGERLPPVTERRGIVLVTGAGGFLGQRTVRELRARGWRVRAITRRPALFADRIPGIEYSECDLAAGLPASLLTGVSTVVHCAAETSGGRAAHERNSIGATRALAEAAADAGVTRFIHVSSLAVLKSLPGALDETTPVDANLGRGPYVWGKAASELVLLDVARRRGMHVRVIRPGPLVDFAAFDPPGRLGREVGPWFVAVGPRRSRLPLVDVGDAAAVLAFAVERFDEVPPVVNLVDPQASTRAALVERLRCRRSDLAVIWIPLGLLKVANPALKLAQRVILGSTRPLDIAAAFDAVAYDTRLAADLIARSRTPTAVVEIRAPAAIGA